MRQYRNTGPYWLNAKFSSRCSCGASIRKGDKILYYPADHKAVCERCGNQAKRDIAADNFDEQVYHYGM